MKIAILSCLLAIVSLQIKAQDRQILRYTGGDIQKFLDKVPNSSEVIFSNIHLTSEQTIVIQNKKDVVLNFNGFTLHAKTTGADIQPIPRRAHKWPRSRSHLVIYQSEGITIKNLNIVGPHNNGGIAEEAYDKRYEAQHALEILGSKNILVDSSRLVKIYGDGVYIGGKSSNIKIQNTAIRKNGRQGIGISSGRNIEISGCEFTEIRRAHIDLECNRDEDRIDNITIRNNTFNRKRLMWIAAASSKGKVSNVSVENNTLNCPASVYIGNRKGNVLRQGPYSFVGNRTSVPYGNPQGAIWKIRNVDGFYAEDNQIIGQKGRGMYLVGALNSSTIDLKNNEVINGLGELKPR